MVVEVVAEVLLVVTIIICGFCGAVEVLLVANAQLLLEAAAGPASGNDGAVLLAGDDFGIVSLTAATCLPNSPKKVLKKCGPPSTDPAK